MKYVDRLPTRSTRALACWEHISQAPAPVIVRIPHTHAVRHDCILTDNPVQHPSSTLHCHPTANIANPRPPPPHPAHAVRSITTRSVLVRPVKLGGTRRLSPSFIVMRRCCTDGFLFRWSEWIVNCPNATVHTTGCVKSSISSTPAVDRHICA